MVRILILFGVTLIAAAAPVPRKLRIEPESISLAGPGAGQRFIASLAGAPGEESDVTAQCRPSNSATVSVGNGALVARAPGAAAIRVNCAGASTTIRVTVGNQQVQGMPISFTGNVLSILTTKGCNSSSCHGSPAGQSGFKLSLYGSDPAADHRAIVQGHEGRRVNLANVDDSLVLRKPSFQVPHGGGHLMTKDSDEYRTLRGWLEQGAKLEGGGARMKSLELYPRERILAGTGIAQPLVAIGRLSDGTTRDMTGEVRYLVNDEAIVSSVKNGAVTAKGRGLTTVLARAMGLTATAQFIVIGSRAQADFATPKPANFIDQFVFAKLKQVNIQPFPLTEDREFLRRVYLDAIGVLPTPAETGALDKLSREQLIDQLLDRPEYELHWLTKFEDWFRNSQYYSQGRTNGSYKRWLRELIRDDRPYDEAVREMLTATGDTTVRPAGNFWHPAIDFMLKTFEVSKAVPTITRLFLGQRLECAECHNHPLENLTQDDFYGMAAFLARTKVKHGYGQYRRIWYNARQGEVLHPATKQPVVPRFLDGTTPAIPDDTDRREILADWITRTSKMQFARATVNRVWAEYFGRGIVDPPDDLRSTNRPTHPELLDKLAEFFIDSGFRFKPLHRLILNSKTYQLKAHTPERPGGTDPLESLLFARYEPRKLPAEVLMDSVAQVLDAPFDFREYPSGTTSKELIASIGGPYFLTTFGFPKRDVMDRRSDGPSLGQALHLMNSAELRGLIEKKDNVLALLDGESDDGKLVEELYLRTYARRPTGEQRQRAESYVASETQAGRSRRRAYENLLWALLNSKEFQLNR